MSPTLPPLDVVQRAHPPRPALACSRPTFEPAPPPLRVLLVPVVPVLVVPVPVVLVPVLLVPVLLVVVPSVGSV